MKSKSKICFISSNNEFQISERKTTTSQYRFRKRRKQKEIQTTRGAHADGMFLVIPNTKEKQPQATENRPKFDLCLARERLHSTGLTATCQGARNAARSLWPGLALCSPLEVMESPGKSKARFGSGSDPEHSSTELRLISLYFLQSTM